MSALVDYYSRRVAEYDAVYRKPERQADLRRMESRIRSLLAGRDVFEIASEVAVETFDYFWIATARLNGRAGNT